MKYKNLLMRNTISKKNIELPSKNKTARRYEWVSNFYWAYEMMIVLGVGLFQKGDAYGAKSDILSSTWESRSPREIYYWQRSPNPIRTMNKFQFALKSMVYNPKNSSTLLGNLD